MRHIRLIVAATLVLAACAAEDPPLAQAPETTEATVVETTAPQPATTDMPMEDHTQEPAGHEGEADEAEHEDEAHLEDEAEHEPDDGTVEGRMITVTMSEFAFEPATIEVSAGETVTFMIENVGLIEHEFRLSNGHRIDEHIASGHADHHDGDEGHHGADGDVIVLVPAGGTANLTFEFPEDTTLYTHVACLIPGHYEAGMVAPLETMG